MKIIIVDSNDSVLVEGQMNDQSLEQKIPDLNERETISYHITFKPGTKLADTHDLTESLPYIKELKITLKTV